MYRRLACVFPSIAALFFVTAAWGVIQTLSFDSPEQEERYRALINELRCLVCQNQSLADSNADLATDLRNITYDMIRAGNSDDEIRTYMSDRYGDFVLYKPPLSSATIVLWAGPFILLFLVLASLLTIIRKRNKSLQTPPGDRATLEHARKLLQSENPGGD